MLWVLSDMGVTPELAGQPNAAGYFPKAKKLARLIGMPHRTNRSFMTLAVYS
jgi:hypothetical protein